MINFSELLPSDFKEKYKHKKPCVIRCNNPNHKKFITNLLSWKNISDYFHDNRRLTNLQIWDGKKKLKNWDCKLYETIPSFVGKSENENLSYYVSKSVLYDYWKKNCTLILPKSSLINEQINFLCKTYENVYAPQIIDTNIYLSSSKNAKTFPAHQDTSENFLFHIIGSVEWKIFKNIKTNNKSIPKEKEKDYEVEFNTILEPGDILYLPKGVFHKSITKEPRITISFPTINEGISLERKYINFDPGVFDVSKAKQ